ncbi:hypothetical protein GCM10009524_41720 [Spirilliplanes yamanashiensis]
MGGRTSGESWERCHGGNAYRDSRSGTGCGCAAIVTSRTGNSQQTFQLTCGPGAFPEPREKVPKVTPYTLAADVDWNDVHAVQLLGAVGGALILLWAIRAMFGRKR